MTKRNICDICTKIDWEDDYEKEHFYESDGGVGGIHHMCPACFILAKKKINELKEEVARKKEAN